MARKGESLSVETKRKLSEAAIERFSQRPKAETEPRTEKRCTKCGLSKELSKFYRYSKPRKSGGFSEFPSPACKDCLREKAANRIKRLRAEGTDMAVFFRERYEREDPVRRRERQREAAATRRREEGKRIIGSRVVKQGVRHGDSLDPAPLVKLLEEELPSLAKARNEANRADSYQSNGMGVLAERAGVSQRRIYGLLRGEYKRVGLATADKLLVGLGLPHMLPILYPED